MHFFQGCVDSNFKFSGSDILGKTERATEANDEWDCQKRCKDYKGCILWTLNEKKLCYLKTYNALNNRIFATNAYSGTADCPGSKCLRVANVMKYEILIYRDVIQRKNYWV